MSTHVAADKHTAERYRIARGFSSFREWRDQNRKAWRDFHGRMSIKGENRERLQTLMDLLDADFERYIRPYC